MYAHEAHLGSRGQNVREVGREEWKCNRFVGDAYAIGAGVGYDRYNYAYDSGAYPTLGNNPLKHGYPVSANELASDRGQDYQDRLENSLFPPLPIGDTIPNFRIKYHL